MQLLNETNTLQYLVTQVNKQCLNEIKKPEELEIHSSLPIQMAQLIAQF